MINSPDDLRTLVDTIGAQLQATAPDPTHQRIETHISVLLLHGEHAYKFKKPVDLGFADFSTLARRRYLCHEELRLNRRFAPALYQAVVAVVGSAKAPRLQEVVDPGTGYEGAFEYAVRMQRFADEVRLDQLLASTTVDDELVARFARDIARFHRNAPPADVDGVLGSPDLVREQILNSLIDGPDEAQALSVALADRLTALSPLLGERQQSGHIRDCHGDLHTGNVVLLHGVLTPFDCIEFNPSLRIIDTAADIAFLIMSLDAADRTDLANTVLAHYLETSGDYDALRLLPLYLAYRALVRAKVANLQSRVGDEIDEGAVQHARKLALLARAYLLPPAPPALWITHGLCGSGKSYSARHLAKRYGCLHLRSDIERRRILGLALDARTDSQVGSGAYTAQVTARTYASLQEAATNALAGGFSVVVDATFLSASRRRDFAHLAESLGVAFHILDCAAPTQLLRQRIRQRAAQGHDPSEATEAVLDAQLKSAEPLSAEEQPLAISSQKVLDDAADLPISARPGLTT